MKPLLLFVTLIIAAFAQTAVKPEQIRSTPAQTIQLLAISQDGKLTRLTLGDGLQISGTTITAAPSEAPVLTQTRLLKNSQGNYPTTTGLVTRNGVIQERGTDYSITTAGIIPHPLFPWSDEDVILAITAERPVIPATAKTP